MSINIMINIKNYNQETVFAPWTNMGIKRCNLLETLWPGLLRDIILPILAITGIRPCSIEGKEVRENTDVVQIQNPV
jgi:hypothetical protein